MARTKGSKNVNSPRSPRKKFEKLPPFKKTIVYNYWIHISTKGEEGWDNTEAGTVRHWQASQYIQEHTTKKSFYHLAKVSVYSIKIPSVHVAWKFYVVENSRK